MLLAKAATCTGMQYPDTSCTHIWHKLSQSVCRPAGDPPIRIDYVWSTDQPLACSLFSKKVGTLQ